MSDRLWNESAARDPLAALCNTGAEQALLGALFLNNKAYEHVVDTVSPEDFGNGMHGRIYENIGKLIERGQIANAITLKNVFDQDEGLSTLGGAAYLGQLVAAAVSVQNAPNYAKTIADLARRRDIVTAAQDAIADATVVDPERPADTVLDEAEERLFSIGERRIYANGPTPIGQIVHETIGQIEAAYKAGGAVTVDTGLDDLDRIISGMGAGDLVVLGGRPGMGKSALAGTVTANVAKRGKRVAVFSLEMSKTELSARWLAGLTGISTDRQRHGQLDTPDWDKLTEAAAYLEKLGIEVDDQPRMSIGQIRQRARRMRRRHGLDLLIVDHLQLVRQGGRQENRRLEIGDASSMLKAVAKELRLPVLLLSQLNRSVEGRDNKRPVLADLRESGDVEQDADVVMFLYREEYYLSRAEPRRKQGQTGEGFAAECADWQDRLSAVRGLAEIEVAKNRHGRTGMARIAFNGERQRFENLESR